MSRKLEPVNWFEDDDTLREEGGRIHRNPWDCPRLEQARRSRSLAELERKRNRASRRGHWTVEDLDCAYVKACEMLKKLNLPQDGKPGFLIFAP